MQKNCGHTHQCGCSHVLLPNEPATEKSLEKFENDKQALKNEIKALEDPRKRPMAHLHLHTFHSILDGAGSVENYIKLAKEYNHPAMAITDHGTLSGTFDFWKKCKAAGLKPIIGMEAYINNNIGKFEDKKLETEFEGGNSHQSIFIMNKEGFVNLNHLAYKSYSEGFYYRGRIKTDWLIEHKQGLFVTTSCAVSYMSKLTKEGKYAEAEEYLKILMREFGDNLVAELQFNEYDHQKIYNAWLIKMIAKYSLMPILTNDVHYAFKEEAKLQDTLLSINRHTTLSDPKAFKLQTRNLYYANVDDFHRFNKEFGFNYQENFINMCLDNTLKVVEKCSYDFDTKNEKYPRFEAPAEVVDYFKTTNTKEIITRLAFGKLKQKIEEYKHNKIVIMTPEKEQEYRDRLAYELQVIEEKDALDYFLVYWEIIRDYKQKGYDIGPGRGCFYPGSRVMMSDGMFAPIETIEAGDEVFDAYGDIRKVIDTLEYDIEEDIIELEFDDGRKIRCTLDHEILTINRGWVEAKDLTEEDEISEIKNKTIAKLKSKTIIPYKGKVHDLTVEETHSYNIEGISVHNSAAGCLLSWCLEITSIDPIRFDLYFERFMNPTRKSMPDIDVDFETGTDHITDEFLVGKYGRDRVLNVSTFSTFSEKGCLKDVVRAHLGKEYTERDSDVEAVTREMPNWDKVQFSLKDWFNNWPKDPLCSERVRNWLTNNANRTILEETIKLQGQVKGIGQHAAGIVITPGPCWEYLPTNIIASNKSIVTAFQEADKSGKDLSELLILKLDRLKIETLSVIKEAIAIIKKEKGVDVSENVRNVNLEDKNLYAELRMGMNHGIFQFESAGMNALIRGMNSDSFEEVVAANALYRPGPMGIKAHEEYIQNKFSPQNIHYVHPLLEDILGKTNGVLIFQEQLMFLAHKIGGMSLGEGDMLRRYMDKASGAILKKANNEELSRKEQDNYKEFDKYWNKFLEGAVKSGNKAAEVDVIKNWVSKYIGYSFNRSHSVCYAFLAMQTLYLKHYYPTEFYTALLNHPKDSGKKEKVQEWLASAIAAAMSKGIKILPPSTKSGWAWTMTGDKEISMGFSGVNGLGEIAYAELESFVEKKEKSLSKFSILEFFDLPFTKFNKTAFGACVKAGVFDSWSDSREFLLSLKDNKRKKIPAGQGFLFDMAGEEFESGVNSGDYIKTTPEEKKKGFIEVCNFDLEKIEKITNVKTIISEKAGRIIENIINFEGDDWYFFILDDVREEISKSGKPYIVLKVGDGIGHTKLRVFSPMAEKIKPILEIGKVYVSKFEKNQGGFINFKRNAKIKVVDL